MSGNLHELQQRMAHAVMQPLTTREQMRRRDSSGCSNERDTAEFIRPNDRLSSFERLEIYNRQYWFRLFSSFEEDFPGLQTVTGKRRFQALMRVYLTACPSTSFSLRNLGSRLVTWLEENPAWTEPDCEIVLGMAKLEWAHIEAFDSAAWPGLTADAVAGVTAQSRIALQPYLRLVEASYAVDDVLIAIRRESAIGNASSNNASTGHGSRRLRTIHNVKRERVYIAVHRYQDTVYYRRIAAEDYRLLLSLQQGKTLGDAIDVAFESSEIAEENRPAHLHSAFDYWMKTGWLCAPPKELEGKEA